MKHGKRCVSAFLFLVAAFGFCAGDVQAARTMPAGKYRLNYSSVTMRKKTKLKLRVTSGSKPVSPKNLIWKSSKKDVASVGKKGVVTARKKGVSVISAKPKRGGKALKCRVKVKHGKPSSKARPASSAKAYDGIYPWHEPYGTGVGAMPGRVVWSHEPDSVDWDGKGYWWETDHFDEKIIQKMVNRSIASLAGKKTAKEGWKTLFAANNASRGLKGGYKAGEKIAIKANINGSAVMDNDASGRTSMSYTNPVLLKALLLSMVEKAEIRPEDITIYDVSRLFPGYMVEMCGEGALRGVRFVGRDNGKADENAPIIWSHKFSGRVSYLPECVTEAKYVINLANLKGHSYGITLCGKNHFGSFINGNAMRPPEGANLHQWLTKSEMGIYSPLVDLMANADLGGKTVLYMLDALICAPDEGADITKKNSTWRQEPFNGDFTSSIFVSQDPVAIDSVGADFLANEPTLKKYNGAASDRTNENYLHEAGLVADAPSGTRYTNGRGTLVKNLGVHEHWNNSSDKQYGRNLGKKEGIELVRIGK